MIRQYAALLDPSKIGLGLLAYVTVKLEKKGRMPAEQFTRSVQSWPEGITCYAMTGDTDCLMRVPVEDLDHYSRFVMQKLIKQPGVIRERIPIATEQATGLPRARRTPPRLERSSSKQRRDS